MIHCVLVVTKLFIQNDVLLIIFFQSLLHFEFRLLEENAALYQEIIGLDV